MSTEVKSRVCLDCASVNKFRWLPCTTHSPAVASGECSHEWTSATLVHNGWGYVCHDCGYSFHYVNEGE